MPTPTREELARKEAHHKTLIAAAEEYLVTRRAKGIEQLTGEAAREFRRLQEGITVSREEVDHYRSELERATLPPHLAHLGGSALDATGHSRAWAKQTASDLRRAFGSEQRAVISGSVDVPQLIPDYVTPIPHPNRLIDLFASRLAVESMVFEFYRQVAQTNNAAPVPDNALKPTSTLTVQAITDRCRVVAHLSEPLPFGIWLDEQAISSWLQSEMASRNGFGTSDNVFGTVPRVVSPSVPQGSVGWRQCPAVRHFAELLQRGLGLAQGGNRVGSERDGRRARYGQHTGHVLTLAVARDGLRLNSIEHPGCRSRSRRTRTRLPQRSRSMASTAILADWSQLKLFVREQMRIDLDASGVLFQHNQIQLRAESRVGVGILRPQSFAIIDLA